MTRRTIVALVVIAVILAAIYFIQKQRNEDETTGANLSLTAFNETQNTAAAAVTARQKDVIVYTLTAENPTDDAISGYVFEANITDITELATLVDAQGANYNSSNNSLVWTPVDLPENSFAEKRFTVRIKDELPANSDLVMSMKFNNEIAINVTRSTVAGTADPATGPSESPSFNAPNSGPAPSIIAMLALAVTAGIFLMKLATKMGKV